MLDFLRIRALALIDDVSLEFGGQMNVLTGETGAGKSMIIDSLSLLRGGKGRGEMVRDGQEQAKVQAQFRLPQDPRLLALLRELDIPLDDDSLLLERTVSANGRGRCLINSQLATVGTMSRIGEILLDICSQHEHHSLTHVSRHLELLDAFANLEPLTVRYGTAYEQWHATKKELEELRGQASESVSRADYLRYQLEELANVDLDPALYEESRSRLVFLRDAQKWLLYAQEARDVLYEDDDSVWSRLSSLLEKARRGNGPVKALAEMIDHLALAQSACDDAARAASHLASDLDADPEELARLDDYIAQIEHLRRKHGCEVAELAARVEKMQRELSEFENYESTIADLESRESKQRELAVELAHELRAGRLTAARSLSRAIEDELRALCMPKARLEVRFQHFADSELSSRGLDHAELMFSANPGEPLAPLHRVASGGELSRVLLAVKGVLATGDQVVTYVFDEVDSGVGGAVAEAIGVRLKRTSLDRQVLCITHLPQIAAFADRHYRVQKTERDGRTYTEVVELSEAERVEELARMLAGATTTASAREHAAELIAEARRVTAAYVSGNAASTGSGPKAKGEGESVGEMSTKPARKAKPAKRSNTNEAR